MITLTGPDDPRIQCAALGVDPGPTYSAYVYMAALRSGHIPIVRAWYVPHSFAQVWTMLDLLLEGRDIFAIEAVEGEVFKGRSATQTFATTKVEGRIQEAAEVRGFAPASSILEARTMAKPYVEISQRAWRTELLGPHIMGMRCKLDPVIKTAITAIYGDEIPPVEGHARDARVHINDGIGVTLVALARMTGRPLMLPNHIRTQIVDAAFKAKASAIKNKWNREHGLGGGPGSGRKLTRQQRIQAGVKRAITIARKAR